MLHTQKDIVARLGLHADIQLLDTETDAAHQLFHGAQDASQTWLDEAIEFSPSFYNALRDEIEREREKR